MNTKARLEMLKSLERRNAEHEREWRDKEKGCQCESKATPGGEQSQTTMGTAEPGREDGNAAEERHHT